MSDVRTGAALLYRPPLAAKRSIRATRCRLSVLCRLISAREPPWFSPSSAAPRTTPPNRAGARFEQVVACCAPRRPLLPRGRVHRDPDPEAVRRRPSYYGGV